MKTEITLEHLFNLINTHLESGGVVIDTYGDGDDRDTNIVGRVVYDDDNEDTYSSFLHLYRAGSDCKATTIPSSDILTLEGHEVAYTSNSYFYPLGRVSFLNPAPVDLNPAPVDLPRADAAAAAAAYAAAVSRCSRAVEARDAAADADIEATRDAADAAADAKAARAAYEAANEAANAAYEDMVAAKAALEAARDTD